MNPAHGLPFLPHAHFRVGTPDDYKDAALIVVTAGAKQAPGESRIGLLHRNAQIIGVIMDEIVAQGSQAVVLLVSNPVDILTRVALVHSQWPRARVFGSGTALDSARFRYLLSRHCGVDARNVHAYILGEHGDSEFAAWSLTHIAGMPMQDYCAVCRKCEDWDAIRARIAEEVRNSAYHIIDYKGATNFAIGLALVRIARAVLRDEHSVLTVSALLDGEFGLEDVCLGVPCVVSSSGVERIIEADLSATETEPLHASAGAMQKAWDELQGIEPYKGGVAR